MGLSATNELTLGLVLFTLFQVSSLSLVIYAWVASLELREGHLPRYSPPFINSLLIVMFNSQWSPPNLFPCDPITPAHLLYGYNVLYQGLNCPFWHALSLQILTYMLP